MKAEKVGLPGGQLSRRHSSFTFAKEELSHYACHTGAFGQLGGYTLVLKLPVPVVRRLLDPLQPLTGRGFSKLRLLQEQVNDCNEENKDEENDEHE
jgi:hypothetical protein